MHYVADNMIWEMHSSSSGHTTLTGKEEIANMDAGNMPEKMNFQFSTIVVEGDTATVAGTSDGITTDGKEYMGTFCDIYHFKDGKIVKMTSYIIDSFQ